MTTPQKCENCEGEFQRNLVKFDMNVLGYPFYLCRHCLNTIVAEKLRETGK